MTSIVTRILDCLQPLTDCVQADPANCRGPRVVPTLPQDDTRAEREQRRRELANLQKKYVYEYGYIPGLAMVKTVPLREYPGLDWFLLALGQATKVAENLVDLLLDPRSFEGAEAASVDDRHVTAFRDRLRELTGRHEELLDVHRRREQEAVAQVRSQPAESMESGRETPDTAVFAGDGSNLLWRDAWESATWCSCGSVFGRCGERLGSASAVVDWALTPCAYCAKKLALMLLDELEELVGSIISRILRAHGLFGRPKSIEDYNHQFQRIPLPELGRKDGPEYFEDDRVFALRQVAGQNPMMLTLVTDLAELRKKLPITNKQYQGVMGSDDTPTKAVKENRLYYVDYSFSAGIKRGSNEPRFAGQKYIGSPIGLFALDDDRELTAVAIQCRQEPGDDNPIITPGDGENWKIARAVFDNAAGNNSEFVQHLGYAHLLVEAFGLAAVRTLPPQHPLSVLLTPHMEATMFVNEQAQSGMAQPPELNAVAAEISATVQDTLRWTSDAVAAVDVNDWALAKHFERNGTDDPSALPHYPYREDSLRIWGAINEWVDAYVRLYYRSDADVAADYELQQFGRECVSADGGRLDGVGENGRFATVDGLVDLMTLIVYQASAHHALTNFPLQKIELYSPALPLAIYQPPPTSATGATFEDYLAYLPPLEISAIQMSLYFVIGTLHYTRLGQYPPGWFADPRVVAPLRAFQKRLTRIECEIDEDNDTRPMPYIYLLPSRIPQSINI